MDNTYKNERIDRLKLSIAILLRKRALGECIKKADETNDWSIKSTCYEKAARICKRMAELENFKKQLMNMATLD